MIQLKNLSKSFSFEKETRIVLSEVSLEFAPGTVTSIVGPTGQGKSTLLSCIAGLDALDSGSVNLDLPPAKYVGYMMQDPHLLPWRTLLQNAILGAEIQGLSGMTPKAVEYFANFGLAGSEHIYPDAASGGMKQRVALIRTLITEPPILLLDEPFSSLDFDTKLRVQKQVIDYHRRMSSTVVLVTHDIEDAIALSDFIIVLSSERPCRGGRKLSVDLSAKFDPISARKSARFAEYFAIIWDELKLAGNGERTQ